MKVLVSLDMVQWHPPPRVFFGLVSGRGERNLFGCTVLTDEGGQGSECRLPLMAFLGGASKNHDTQTLL